MVDVDVKGVAIGDVAARDLDVGEVEVGDNADDLMDLVEQGRSEVRVVMSCFVSDS